MKVYDISVTLQPGIPLWPGDPPLVLERVQKIEEGADANVSRLDMGVHTGTHIDAPYHFLTDGGLVEDISLDVLIGPAQVIEFPESCDRITAAVLQEAGIKNGVQRLLFKTRNSACWVGGTPFRDDFIALWPDGAEYLVESGVKLVGIDYLSVAPFTDGVTTHRILLEGGIVILEGIDLSQAPAGDYVLYCLPLKLGRCEGAPARAILQKE